MGLLFIMRDWDAPSELWMHRMRDGLADQITMLAAQNPNATGWRGVPVVSLRAGPASWPRRLARQLGLQVWQKPKWTVQDRLAQALHQPSVDRVLVHYIDWALQLEGPLTAAPHPLFVHCHGLDAHPDAQWEHDPGRPMYGPDHRDRLVRLSQRAIYLTPSEATRQRLTNLGVASERVVACPMGVPREQAATPRQPRTAGLNLLYLGRLTDFKGPDLTLKAFEIACDRGLDARLTIAGGGALEGTLTRLHAQSHHRGRIELLGAVDAATGRRLRAEADIFTAHNRLGPVSRVEEAFGVAYVEAQAAGLPVVTGRSGGLTEIVVHEETGVLFEPGDVEAHAAALLRLAREPELRLRMGAAGASRAAAHFSLEAWLQRLRSVLNLPPARLPHEPVA